MKELMVDKTIRENVTKKLFLRNTPPVDIKIPKFLMNKRCAVMHQYNVYKPLGSGGFGAVFAATRKCDIKPVAFKLISRKNIPSWIKYKKKLVPTEIYILGKLNHIEGVIKLFEVYERSDSYIMVMDRPEPVIDLFDYITRRKTLTEIEAANILKDLIKTLKQVHAAGIVHRDIKDENILINLNTRKIKLIDFGGAAPLKNELYHDFDGTRVYSPPEWIAYRCYYAIPACVWSLGILIYNMLYGDVPFDNDHLIVAASPDYKKLPNISSLAISFIKCCLNHRQSCRPNLEEMLLHEWIVSNTIFTHSELLMFILEEEKKIIFEEENVEKCKMLTCRDDSFKEKQHAVSDHIFVKKQHFQHFKI